MYAGSLLEVQKTQKETGETKVLALVSMQGQWPREGQMIRKEQGGLGLLSLLSSQRGRGTQEARRSAGTLILPSLQVPQGQAISKRQCPRVVGASRGLALSTREVRVSTRSELCPTTWDPLSILVTYCLSSEEPWNCTVRASLAKMNSRGQVNASNML